MGVDLRQRFSKITLTDSTRSFFTHFAVVVSARVRRSRSRLTLYRITLENIALRRKTNCRLKNQSLRNGI